MIEKKIKSTEEVPSNHYRLWFRCTNCGVVFQYDLHKGIPAVQMTGSCPQCGAKSGKPTFGVFTPLKYNPKYDKIPTYYS